MMAIEDTGDTWDQAQKDLQSTLVNAAEEWGIRKVDFDKNLNQFDIENHVRLMKECPKCKQGLACEEHKLVKKDRRSTLNIKCSKSWCCCYQKRGTSL